MPSISPAPAPVAGPGPADLRNRPLLQRRRRPRTHAAMWAALVALAAAAAWLGLRGRTVATGLVVRGTAIDAVYGTGTVEPRDRVWAKSKLAGTLVELAVREGDRVQKGDLLARVDAASLRFDLSRSAVESRAAQLQAERGGPQLAALEAQARGLEAELEQARRDAERLDRLAAQGVAAAAEVDRVRSRVAALQAQLDTSRSQRRSLEIDLGARASGSRATTGAMAARLADAEIRSPINGVVLARAVEAGEVVAVNQPLLKLGDTTSLLLECAIDEADVARVAVGNRVAVSLYAYPKEVFLGDVQELLPDADRARRSFLAKVVFREPPRGLRSGMTAEVNVVVDEHAKTLLAPADAVGQDGTAWVVSRGRARRRQVRTGIRDLSWVEALEGLGEGDLVVVSGSEGLRDGGRVRAKGQEPLGGSPTRERGGKP